MDTVINDSFELSRKINDCLEGIQIPNQDSHLFSTLFHNIVVEYQRSIAVLTKEALYGSACCLVRPLFESYVKGLWFYKCATENDFLMLRKDKFKKIFNDLVKDIENIENLGLIKAKERYWRNLNSLTHTGTAQLARRIYNNEIRNAYSNDFMVQTLKFSNMYALLSCGELAEISSSESCQKQFSTICSEMWAKFK
ncbi:MAG: hypothetical protein MI799_03075 [Desulfobacterales bacterium]|nr:hypothetical protein [Desulfobacterales bacterium]